MFFRLLFRGWKSLCFHCANYDAEKRNLFSKRCHGSLAFAFFKKNRSGCYFERNFWFSSLLVSRRIVQIEVHF